MASGCCVQTERPACQLEIPLKAFCQLERQSGFPNSHTDSTVHFLSADADWLYLSCACEACNGGMQGRQSNMQGETNSPTAWQGPTLNVLQGSLRCSQECRYLKKRLVVPKDPSPGVPPQMHTIIECGRLRQFLLSAAASAVMLFSSSWFFLWFTKCSWCTRCWGCSWRSSRAGRGS